MKDVKKYIFLGGAILIVFFGIIPTIAYSGPIEGPPPPPPPQYIKPTSYDIYTGGSYYSGSLSSVYSNDGNYLIAKAGWFWFIVYSFQVTIDFDFVNTKCNKIKVDIADNAPNYNMLVHVSYTTGPGERFPSGAGEWPNGWLNDGYYVFSIDGSRFLDHITIQFYHSAFLGGDKYLKVDLLVAELV